MKKEFTVFDYLKTPRRMRTAINHRRTEDMFRDYAEREDLYLLFDQDNMEEEILRGDIIPGLPYWLELDGLIYDAEPTGNFCDYTDSVPGEHYTMSSFYSSSASEEQVYRRDKRNLPIDIDEYGMEYNTGYETYHRIGEVIKEDNTFWEFLTTISVGEEVEIHGQYGSSHEMVYIGPRFLKIWFKVRPWNMSTKELAFHVMVKNLTEGEAYLNCLYKVLDKHDMMKDFPDYSLAPGAAAWWFLTQSYHGMGDVFYMASSFMGYRPSVFESLETLDDEVKDIYDTLIQEEENIRHLMNEVNGHITDYKDLISERNRWGR